MSEAISDETTKSEAKKTVRKARTVPNVQETGSMVYIGPDIPGAKQYTVYNAGLPDALNEQIVEHRVFESLVVPVERMANASAELAKEGSALNVLYQKASALKNK